MNNDVLIITRDKVIDLNILKCKLIRGMVLLNVLSWLFVPILMLFQLLYFGTYLFRHEGVPKAKLLRDTLSFIEKEIKKSLFLV